jgi:2-oxoglutarate ferredoxin oxidoreductase subunit beta
MIKFLWSIAMMTEKNFDCSFENKWCPGCGNFSILEAMKDAFVKLNLPPEKLLIVSGIGQAAKTPHFLKCNMFHGLHGRALPVATGAKLANHELTIVVNSGDGDCYGEGGNHFLNVIRRNVDLTLLVHDNKVYGLTKGQASPTSDPGMITRGNAHGVIAESFNPLTVALCLGAGFVARGFSGEKEQLSTLIQEGVKHKGISLIDILQPCVSFNKINTYSWYKNRIYDVNKEQGIPNDFDSAIKIARQWDDKIPTGIFYQKEKPSFTEKINALKEGTLISRDYNAEKLQALLTNM